MKLLKRFRTLKANSLLESVIAIAMISVCVLIALIIYVNVIQQNKSISYYEAKHKIALFTEEMIQKNDYENNSYSFEGYSIDKKVTINKEEHTALLTWTIKTIHKTYVENRLIPYNEK